MCGTSGCEVIRVYNRLNTLFKKLADRTTEYLAEKCSRNDYDDDDS